MKKHRDLLWLLIPLCLSPLSYAHAYLDPNSGSYIIQIAIGMILGGTYALRNFFKRLATWLRSRSKKNGKDKEGKS